MKSEQDFRLMRPVVDYAFKKLFADESKDGEGLLIDFLNSLLKLEDDNKIKHIIYLNPFNNRKYEADKESILDVKVKTENGQLIDVEIQINNIDNYRKRSLYYWAKLYAEGLEKGQPYYTLKKSIVISIMDFRIIKETNHYHSVFSIKEKTKCFDYLDDLEIHYVELPKFDETKDINCQSMLELWLTFLKTAGNDGKEDMLNLIRERSGVIDMATERLRELSADERNRQMYLQREKWEQDKASQAKYAEYREKEGREIGIKEGIKEGLKEGRKEMAIEIAKKMIDAGTDSNTISAVTGLSLQEIEKLKSD